MGKVYVSYTEKPSILKLKDFLKTNNHIYSLEAESDKYAILKKKVNDYTGHPIRVIAGEIYKTDSGILVDINKNDTFLIKLLEEFALQIPEDIAINVGI
jgi:hypothetical protein